MKKFIGTETDDIENSTETESLIANAPSRMSNHKTENFSSVSVAPEEVAPLIKAVTDPLTQQLTHLFEFIRELNIKQANRRHEETT